MMSTMAEEHSLSRPCATVNEVDQLCCFVRCSGILWETRAELKQGERLRKRGDGSTFAAAAEFVDEPLL